MNRLIINIPQQPVPHLTGKLSPAPPPSPSPKINMFHQLPLIFPPITLNHDS